MELIKVNLLHKIRFRLLFVQYKKVSRTLGSTYVFLGAPKKDLYIHCASLFFARE